MSDLRALYQETILEHGKNPRNQGTLPDATHAAAGHNPLCGDRCRVELRVEGGRLAEVRFTGQGCAISTASASLMTEALRGRELGEARRVFAAVHGLVTAGATPDVDLGKLEVFAGVRQFPMRVKCATLPWHTLIAALDGRPAASTEEEP